MRRFFVGLVVTAALAGVVRPPAARAAANEEWDDKAVELAIRRAVRFLWARWSNGTWEGRIPPHLAGRAGANFGGSTALCAYALLATGENPQTKPMKQTLDWLAERKMKGTYARSLRCNVWAMLGGRKHKYRRKFMDDVRYIVDGADRRGGYDYVPHGRRVTGAGGPPPKVRYDNSNSQLAVLAAWVGQENGVEVPLKYWQLIERHWREDQQNDGGWSYYDTGNSYGSMSVAGLATAFICYDAIHYRKFTRCMAKTDYAPIVNGLKWLDVNFSATSNPGRGHRHYYYYLYGVERVGLASGYKYFGRQDWYKLGTTALLGRQRPDGSWGSIVETSFALLFLARGRHPILFNKLNYPGSWNPRPRDMANLTRWVSRTFERTVNWQIVNLDAPVRELHDAPILYISGSAPPKLKDRDLTKLREFVLQGGVILSEAACNRAPFTLAMRKYYRKMFPEYELRRLGSDHDIYNLHFKISTPRRGLSGISNGVRLLAIHSPTELSLAWQLRQYATGADVFKLGANIYFFVTDKGILPPRGVCHWPKGRAFVPVETVRITPVKHQGNWNPEPYAWKRFAILMGNRHKVRVELTRPTELTSLDPNKSPVAVMTGTTRLELIDAQRQALRNYLTKGGTLVVDAAGGSKNFTGAVEKELKALLPGSSYGPISLGHPLFTKVGPVITEASYRRSLRLSVYAPKRPRLRGLTHGKRLVVLFSPDDLTAALVGYPLWGLKGYQPDSAFELMRNIVLYASGKTISN